MTSAVGSLPVMATVLAGLSGAQRRMADAAQTLTSPGALAPVDSVEFSRAATAASPDAIAGAAIEMSSARTQVSAMVLVARAENKMEREAIDLLA